MLVEHMGFPVAKVNEPDMVGSWQHDILLKNCTKYFPKDEIFTGLDFNNAMPFYQRRWEHLPSELQEAAKDVLGYGPGRWNGAHDATLLKGKSWKELTVSQKKVLEQLDCSPIRYDRNECRIRTPIDPEVERAQALLLKANEKKSG
jgi:hypothetical protein